MLLLAVCGCQDKINTRGRSQVAVADAIGNIGAGDPVLPEEAGNIGAGDPVPPEEAGDGNIAGDGVPQPVAEPKLGCQIGDLLGIEQNVASINEPGPGKDLCELMQLTEQNQGVVIFVNPACQSCEGHLRSLLNRYRLSPLRDHFGLAFVYPKGARFAGSKVQEVLEAYIENSMIAVDTQDIAKTLIPDLTPEVIINLILVIDGSAKAVSTVQENYLGFYDEIEQGLKLKDENLVERPATPSQLNWDGQSFIGTPYYEIVPAL
jgi:hypothetical protein